MRIRVVKTSELGAAEWFRWAELQDSNPTLSSPFFRPEFTIAMAQTQPSVHVGVIESQGSIAGFFPFETHGDGVGIPVGGRLSDYQGVVAGDALVFDPRELVGGSSLQNWRFDHVPATQRLFAPFARSAGESPQMDLSNGFAAFAVERPQAGSRPFRRLADLRRQLARHLGPLRFEFSSRRRSDLDALLRLKSDQYSRTKSVPVFELPGVVESVDLLWSMNSEAFSTALSTLHAGETLVAVHLGLRSRDVLHWWFPAYDPQFARYSPGLLLLLSLAEEAGGLGIRVIDLGKGPERYKRRFANRSVELLEGRVVCAHTGVGVGLPPSAGGHSPQTQQEMLDHGESVALTPSLAELRDTWDAFGATDPLWAICMRPDRKHELWDLEQFFETGELEIAADLRHMRSLGLAVATTSALDFGCGIGRITQPLARRFDRVVGVDVSPRLIAEARRLDGSNRRASYVEQTREDLAAFPDASFDLVYCCNVLQTMPTDLGVRYLREFLRVVVPGGVVFFQVPVEFRDLPFQLPPDAFSADVSFLVPSLSLAAGSTTNLSVTIRNISARRWPASFCDGRSQDLRVGNHWLDAEGRMVLADDGRSHVPKPLRPGESVTVPLAVTAPDTPGRYLLEVDLVVEGTSWFGARGSKVQSIPVEVAPAGLPDPCEADRAPEAVMAMNVIPREMIGQVVAEGGGRIVDVREDHRSGAVWRAMQFTVVREVPALARGGGLDEGA